MVPDVVVSSWVHSSTSSSWSECLEKVDTEGNRVWVLLSVAGANASGLGKDSLIQLAELSVFSSERFYQWITHENVVMQEAGATLRVVVMLIIADQTVVWLSLGGKLILKRGEQIGSLLTGETIVAVQGKTRDGDVLLLSTLPLGHDRLLFTQLANFHSLNDLVAQVSEQLASLEHEAGLLGNNASNSQEDATSTQIGGVICIKVNTVAFGTTTPLVVDLSQDDRTSSTRSIATTEPATDQVNNIKLRELARASLNMMRRQVPIVVSTVHRIILKLGAGNRPTAATLRGLLHKRTRITHRTKIILGIVMLGLTIGTVALTLGWAARHNQQQEQLQAAQTVQPFFEKLQAIQTLSHRDLQAATTQLQALTTQATDTIAKPHPAYEQPYWSSVVAALSQTQRELRGSNQTVEATVVLNVQAQVPNFAGSVISLNDTQVVMVDQVSKQVVTWERLTNKVTAFSLEKVGEIKSIAFAGNEKGYVLANDGVFYLNLTRQRLEPLAVGAAYWKSSKYIANSATFLYFFNLDKRTIYRVKATQAQVGEPVNWLITPLGVVAEQVNGMWATDAVWLTTKEAQIRQYLSGRPTGFAFTGLEKPWSSPLQVLSPPDSAYIYVFAPSQSSLYIFSQSGELLRQVTNSVLGGCVSVAVDETRGRFLAVSGSVVYQLPLWPQATQ